jgi:hypothetical protein
MARAAHPAPPSHGPRATARPCAAQSRHGPGSVVAIVGQLCALANPARDWRADPGPGTGGTRPRVTWGFDVTPVRAGGFRHLPGLYRRSDSRSRRVNPLPRPRVDCTTPRNRQTGRAQERRATHRPAQAGVAPVSRAPVVGHARAAGVGGCGGGYRRLPGRRSWRLTPSARAAAGTTPTGSLAPRCRTPPCADRQVSTPSPRVRQRFCTYASCGAG